MKEMFPSHYKWCQPSVAQYASDVGYEHGPKVEQQ